MVLFFKRGYACIINREKGETNESMFKRGWFIISQQDKDLERVDKFARVWINHINNGCVYPDDVMLKINEMESKTYE